MVDLALHSPSPVLDRVFAALADPTRRAILAALSRGPATVSDLAEPFRISLQAVSKHLGVLERAGLLRREADGRLRRCTLEAAPLKDASAWIEHYRVFWEGNLDALERFLEQTEAGGDDAPDGGRAAPHRPRKEIPE